MSQDFLPPDFWEQGTTDNSVPSNDNALRFHISQTNVNNATTAQPGSPADGDTYIIQSTHTGSQWASFTPKSTAVFWGGTWYEFLPHEGQRVSISGAVYVYTSGAWTAASGGGGSVPSVTNTGDVLTVVGGVAAWAPPGIEQNSQSAAYTLVLTDKGKQILHPSADTTARIFTIPANSSVAFPINTAVTFINQNAAGVITIAITTDTMRLAGSGSTGSRTLAANGIATAVKITSTEWIISGTGLT